MLILGRKNERNMKKIVTICLIFTWVVSFGCKQEKIIRDLPEGRKMLLEAGLAVESISVLKRAEEAEEVKAEPRALLLIAYSHALSWESAWLKRNNLETEYHNERTRRLSDLNSDEIEEIIQILNEKKQVEKDVIQILIDKGTPVIPIILNSFIQNRYDDAYDDFAYILTQIGVKGLEEIMSAIEAAETPTSVKVRLARVLGAMGEAAAKERLEAVKKTIQDAGLEMEINVALYQIGDKEYRKAIEEGLQNSNLVARQAAARSVAMLDQPSTSKLINALKDEDDQVRRSVAIALQKHVDTNAVDNLVEILTNDSEGSTKQSALNTLNHYAENKLADGLAPRLISLLIDTEISAHEDRIRIVQLLNKPALIQQIEAADRANRYANLPHKLYEYYTNKEDNRLVKSELTSLLIKLEETSEE